MYYLPPGPGLQVPDPHRPGGPARKQSQKPDPARPMGCGPARAEARPVEDPSSYLNKLAHEWPGKVGSLGPSFEARQLVQQGNFTVQFSYSSIIHVNRLRANETRSNWTRSIFSVPMRRVSVGRVPMRPDRS